MNHHQYRQVRLILWLILFANFIVAAVKTGIGLGCGSHSVLADGIHSFADGASNIVGLIGIWLASKPRDDKHPYGHGKFEIIASLFIGIMLAFLAVRIMVRGVLSFQNPVILEIGVLEALLMAATIAVNTLVAVTEYRQGKKLKSTILVTDSLHTRGDIMISVGVVLGLIGIKMGLPVWVDGAMSLAVALAVLISAGQIIKNCVNVLVDSAAVDGSEVKNLLMTIPGIYDIHQVRSRGQGSHVFIDLHAVVGPEESATTTHGLSHKLEAVLKKHFGADTEVTIHIEPNERLCEREIDLPVKEINENK